MIARVAFRRRFIKITVPLNLDSYHTALDETETRISAQNVLEMDRSHRPALHGEPDESEDVFRPGGRWKAQGSSPTSGG